MEFIIVDLETTGINYKRDKIIEIGAVKIAAFGKRQTFHRLIDPEIPLPKNITALTGISDDMLTGKPLIEEVIGDFLAFVGDGQLVAHNAAFDGGFLEAFTEIPKEEYLDTLLLAKMAFPMLNSYALANLTEYFGISNDQQHRALSDAEATADLFQLIEETFALADQGLMAAWSHLLSKKYPVYQRYLQRFDAQPLAQKYLPPKAPKKGEEEKGGEKTEEREKYVIDGEELLACFEGKDGLKTHVLDFRPRVSQTEMALAVAAAFNQEEYLLAEAGTGTGKTIAYLLPAVFAAVYGKTPVIISTHTIHLQDQLIKKDIPELNGFFQGNIRAALIKGRNHYLCCRKWENEYENEDRDRAFFMARLLPWVTETQDGDGDILNLNAFEKKDWQRFSAASENCIGMRCPYFHGRCFVRRARKAAENADLIITNHSLLLTDSVRGGGILPHTEHLIIDEAHQLETVAENSLGFSLSYFDHMGTYGELLKILQKLYKRVTFPSLYLNEQSQEKIRERQTFLEELMAKLKDNGDKGRDAFAMFKETFELAKTRKTAASRSWRIDERVKSEAIWEEAGQLLSNLRVWYEEIGVDLAKTASLLESELEEEGYENDQIQFTVAKGEWSENASALKAFAQGEKEGMVAWLEEGNERFIYPILKAAPLNIDQALAKDLYAHKDSVVFVSATLSVNRDFHYFRQTCGLDLIPKKTNELLLPSPFDYRNQSVLVAANDIPLVGTVTEYEYLESVARAVIDLTTAAKGRSLVLFTSHMHLREVFYRVEQPMKDKGVTVLAHEISGSRSTLLRKMREDSRTVILGANSFWEGIDVAGENLSLLIIVRLPFWPPDIPTIAAKLDLLKAQHKNAFGELSLPQAIIRFKQGFGRLLRKEDDRGVICVLDKRIYEKRYGKDFVESLPLNKVYPLSVQDITTLIRERL
ncbi:MAG TPA: helicase C-terminal domain-containing protein [Clostridiales bacterium]|nr:helicase C-terminal domain-containing protein [Clostridiales bacterium]